MTIQKKLRIGTRASSLALAQTQIVIDELLDNGFCDSDIEIIKIETSGDRKRDRPITEVGGKGIFIKELELALLKDEIDAAVHSLKDIPAEVSSDFTLAAFLDREDNSDVLIGKTLSDLTDDSHVGTGSPRRTAILKNIRPELNVKPIRGNIETRIKKMDEGQYDAIILAYAGLKRLSKEDRVTEILNKRDFIPAPGQGVIAIETRNDDLETIKAISKIDSGHQRTISEIEFGILKILGADCSTPIGINTELSDGIIILDFFISDKEFSHFVSDRIEYRLKDIDRAIFDISNIIKESWTRETDLEWTT